MSYYHFNQQAHPTSAVPGPSHTNNHHHHHGGRNRRAPRLSVSQNSNKQQFRGVRNNKDINESAALNAFRSKFEVSRSFDLEDDMEFCPGLLTESDLVSIHSASERSSLASNSPESSPTQQPNHVAPGFSLNSNSPPFHPSSYQQSHHHHQQSGLKLHQPAATRTRNAIPIINPATGISMSSPPPSVSPGRMQQAIGRNW